MKISRPYTGKKNNLPDPTKKQQHADRANKKIIISKIKESDWKEQVKEYENTKI